MNAKYTFVLLFTMNYLVIQSVGDSTDRYIRTGKDYLTAEEREERARKNQNENVSGQNVNVPVQNGNISGQDVNVSGQNGNISGQDMNISGQDMYISGLNVNIYEPSDYIYGENENLIVENFFNVVRAQLNLTPEDKFTMDHANEIFLATNMEVVEFTEEELAEISQNGISLEQFGNIVKQIDEKKEQALQEIILHYL